MRNVVPIAVTLCAAFSMAVTAQSPAASRSKAPTKAPALAAYELYTQRMLAVADVMPEDAYAARLAPGVRSFAESIGHSVDTNFGVCAGARKLESPKKGVNHEQSVSSKAELIAALHEAIAYCTPFVDDAAARGTHASDVNFVNAHNAQMLVLMDAHLIARGLAPGKGSEAAAPAKNSPK